MTTNRRLLASIALTTVAAVCITAAGCGDPGTKGTTKVETTTKSVQTTGQTGTPVVSGKSSTDGVKPEAKADKKSDEKHDVKKSDEKKDANTSDHKKDVKTEEKKDVKKSEEKQAPPFPADKANNAEAGSSTVPGGGVDTPQ